MPACVRVCIFCLCVCESCDRLVICRRCNLTSARRELRQTPAPQTTDTTHCSFSNNLIENHKSITPATHAVKLEMVRSNMPMSSCMSEVLNQDQPWEHKGGAGGSRAIQNNASVSCDWYVGLPVCHLCHNTYGAIKTNCLRRIESCFCCVMHLFKNYLCRGAGDSTLEIPVWRCDKDIVSNLLLIYCSHVNRCLGPMTAFVVGAWYSQCEVKKRGRKKQHSNPGRTHELPGR